MKSSSEEVRSVAIPARTLAAYRASGFGAADAGAGSDLWTDSDRPEGPAVWAEALRDSFAILDDAVVWRVRSEVVDSSGCSAYH